MTCRLYRPAYSDFQQIKAFGCTEDAQWLCLRTTRVELLINSIKMNKIIYSSLWGVLKRRRSNEQRIYKINAKADVKTPAPPPVR